MHRALVADADWRRRRRSARASVEMSLAEVSFLEVDEAAAEAEAAARRVGRRLGVDTQCNVTI